MFQLQTLLDNMYIVDQTRAELQYQGKWVAFHRQLLQDTMTCLLSVSTRTHMYTQTHTPRLTNTHQRIYFLSGQEVCQSGRLLGHTQKDRFAVPQLMLVCFFSVIKFNLTHAENVIIKTVFQRRSGLICILKDSRSSHIGTNSLKKLLL